MKHEYKTLKELIEYLLTLPQDALPVYDNGLGLQVEYSKDEHWVNFY